MPVMRRFGRSGNGGLGMTTQLSTIPRMRPTILLGSIAVEPGRWKAGSTPIRLSRWLDQIDRAGFDGIEIWERHLTAAEAEEASRVLDHPLSVDIFNSYVSLDDPDPRGRTAVTEWVRRTGSTGIKFDVGNDPSASGAYAERIATWLDELPRTVALLCECHHGISIAEEPSTATEIFDAAGSADRLRAIVHTHEDPDHLRRRFDAYGDRITHVHVNFLDFTALTAPRLSDIRGRLESQVALLRSLGFDGSWTIEFSHGVLSEQDEPGFLLDEASSDLRVLREVLG